MNQEETAKLLTVVAAYDNRNVQRETVVVWHQALGHLPLDVAQEAVVAHFTDSTEYLVPAHVHRLSKRIFDRRAREQRLARPALEPAPITLDRERHESETDYWVCYYREHPDER